MLMAQLSNHKRRNPLESLGLHILGNAQVSVPLMITSMMLMFWSQGEEEEALCGSKFLPPSSLITELAEVEGITRTSTRGWRRKSSSFLP